MSMERCNATYEGEICHRYKGHLSSCDYLPMNIIEQIKALPKGKLLHIEHFPVPDDYRGRKTDALIALAESHERLLKAAKAVNVMDRNCWDEFYAAIEEAEKLHG